ncbi:MAG: hypothetical protein C5B50_18875 [Verrucomicrobia bacterium]|nr:MAG: hypothetical protein C5B50_18875 [Verrucomicrobiota bacterium]
MSQLTSHALLTTVLRDVSRSFYLTLRILPAKIRPQIGLAYLLARTSDTITDTEAVPLDQRLTALEAFRQRILGFANVAQASSPASSPGASPSLSELAQNQPSGAEQLLLEQSETSVGFLRELTPPDAQLVREVLSIILSGQELDLRRFAQASPQHIIALQTDAELDDYTYRVAGCVGEFWTKICRAHLFPRARLDDSGLLKDSVRFGKGLQLVNILRDLARDLRQGRCYLPAETLAGMNLLPEDLLKPDTEPRLRPLFNHYMDRAEEHLRAGWRYTNTLPARCVRVRLACAWPILIGMETIQLLRHGNVLGAAKPIKVSRSRVKGLIARSVLYYPLQALWCTLIAPSRKP